MIEKDTDSEVIRNATDSLQRLEEIGKEEITAPITRTHSLFAIKKSIATLYRSPT